MKKTLRHTLIFLLAGIVLTSTTGVSVHKMYCYCKGEMVASVFCPDDPCEIAAVASEKKDCCKGRSCEMQPKSGHKGCSDCRSEFVKLNAQFVVSSFDFQLTTSFPTVLQAVPFIENHPHIVSINISWETDLPPPSGKESLPWLQAYLC
ncbi:MAG: hypothetical protein H6577_25070 [Lewinellaceae bacterium]|nr:hypothetical protein [Saprospiraceae bacterium]MCB9341410.1 hypothetical protein [Lewinellaceae bacterium]